MVTSKRRGECGFTFGDFLFLLACIALAGAVALIGPAKIVGALLGNAVRPPVPGVEATDAEKEAIFKQVVAARAEQDDCVAEEVHELANAGSYARKIVVTCTKGTRTYGVPAGKGIMDAVLLERRE